METTNTQPEKLPGILDLIRIMILIALFGLMICLESSAQVPDKTCCNPLRNIEIEQIRQFLAYLDSIELLRVNQNTDTQTDSNLVSPLKSETEVIPRPCILHGNESGWENSFHYPAAGTKRNHHLKSLMYNPLAWKN